MVSVGSILNNLNDLRVSTDGLPVSSYSMLGNIMISSIRSLSLYFTVSLYYNFRITGGIFGNNFSKKIVIPQQIKVAAMAAGDKINKGLDNNPLYA